ncbi:pentatricopeptide repeat-containing protein At5g02830, chloroplastic isoform X2 [Amaranthus tricolor]|uniref:pentatricopeptide repeat-containing protein At5g02830, chloroplastic isoform X2 n=1 Tax=Amaranthus tricolor TaxID=29722 RepID=UPI002587E6DF|nr:pentatricopeptide repeat-containing protein At5g02830, chloroplastic isoform X2 [Amaranthus tricolor]
MRSFVIITTLSSSIVASTPFHHHHIFTHKQPPFLSLHNFIFLSFSKPTSQTSFSSSSSSFSTSIPIISPHLYPSNSDPTNSDLSFYAEIASKLVEDGRFQDFGMVVETVLSSGIDGSLAFGKLLNSKLLTFGIVKGLKEGRVHDVVELLGFLSKLCVDVLGLFDGLAMGLLKRECFSILNDGHLQEAVELMEILAGFEFPIKDLMKPSDVIRISVKKRSPHLAVRYACLLPHAEILLCTIIKEFGKKSDLASAVKVFEASRQKFGGHNMYVYRTIIDACGLCGDCFKSRLIFEDLLAQKITPNIYVINSLMNVNAHDLAYTMDVYKQMQNLGIEADMTTYNILLKACCRSGRVDVAQDIYREVQHLDSTGTLKIDVFTYSTIIKVFADAKLWQMAIKIKEDMQSAGVIPNTVTWSSLISACANAGLVDQATQLFDEMLMAGCEPNEHCFNALLHACVEGCQYDRAFRLFYTWKSSGSANKFGENIRVSEDESSAILLAFKNSRTKAPEIVTTSRQLSFAKNIPFSPTTTTYNILLKACGTDYYRAKSLIDEMRSLGLSPNHISFSTLIDICGGAGNAEGALQILKSMGDSGIRPDVIAYTTAIKICVENRNLNTAFSLFSEMKRNRVKPNLVTYNTLLRARSKYGSLQEVQQCLAIYQDMCKAGYKSNDYFLKLLIEEWCEGVIQENNQQGQSSSHNKNNIGELRSILLERIATHLRKDTAKTLAVDIQGLTKVEARIVVLAVLRMIKENYKSGLSVNDDLIVILGITKVGTECTVKDAIARLLKTELGLEVIAVNPDRAVNRKFDKDGASSLISNSGGVESSELPTSLDTPTRRPAVLQRLLITRKSLMHWLKRRSVPATKF